MEGGEEEGGEVEGGEVEEGEVEGGEVEGSGGREGRDGIGQSSIVKNK